MSGVDPWLAGLLQMALGHVSTLRLWSIRERHLAVPSPSGPLEFCSPLLGEVWIKNINDDVTDLMMALTIKMCDFCWSNAYFMFFVTDWFRRHCDV